ncbi:hypothetical protein FIBSPDRAFT_853325, partial [Athelia psychrophila]
AAPFMLTTFVSGTTASINGTMLREYGHDIKYELENQMENGVDSSSDLTEKRVIIAQLS